MLTAPPQPPKSQSLPTTTPHQDSAVPAAHEVADVPGPAPGPSVQPQNVTVDAPADASQTMVLDISVSSMEEFLPTADQFDFSDSLNYNGMTAQQMLRPQN